MSHTNFVAGPDGFTETFDDHTVDVLMRMGLIELVKVDEATEHYGEFRTYRSSGRETPEFYFA